MCMFVFYRSDQLGFREEHLQHDGRGLMCCVSTSTVMCYIFLNLMESFHQSKYGLFVSQFLGNISRPPPDDTSSVTTCIIAVVTILPLLLKCTPFYMCIWQHILGSLGGEKGFL